MENAAPSQIHIIQAIVMLNEICHRVFNAKEVFAHLRAYEERTILIALTGLPPISRTLRVCRN